MTLPAHKTKIVCTIGPASENPQVMEAMIRAGMDVARLNFSHGDFSSHQKVVDTVRASSKKVGRRVAIMADLSGPKIRIGKLAQEPIMLKPGDTFTLTTKEIMGSVNRVSVSFERLPQAVKAGDKLFLNDGYIELEVDRVVGRDVCCRVLVGGELRSKKGLNLPGINLGISAFTEQDRRCLAFAMEKGIDAVSQSFVETAKDIEAVRNAAAAMGHTPFIIAKIERAGALGHMDSILEAADGIMIARGDLGVEIPIEQITLVQKELMRKANLMGKPVITATQMLESMTGSRRPTRAEATDVANAILDGTDCVMLSAESAMGLFPVEAVEMLAKIAAAVEPHRSRFPLRESLEKDVRTGTMQITDIIALNVATAVVATSPAAVIIPTKSGATARSISRFRLPVWITAVSDDEPICQRLQFSYGVNPVHVADFPDNWKYFTKDLMKSYGVEGNLAVLTEGPSAKHPETNNRIELMDLSK
jgi:pyruvate kinase